LPVDVLKTLTSAGILPIVAERYQQTKGEPHDE
jgi:hypothetical protein